MVHLQIDYYYQIVKYSYYQLKFQWAKHWINEKIVQKDKAFCSFAK